MDSKNGGHADYVLVVITKFVDEGSLVGIIDVDFGK